MTTVPAFVKPHAFCLMPTYGRPRMVQNSIACFLAQDYPTRTLIIFDDLGNLVLPNAFKYVPPNPELRDLLEANEITMSNVVVRSQPRINIWLLSTKRRVKMFIEKYNLMLLLTQGATKEYFYAVWDDDDIYFPNHLSTHADALYGDLTPAHFVAQHAMHRWSQPEHVWSDYTGSLAQEESLGRFHGSIAFTRQMVDYRGGWPYTEQADFDQQMIAELGKTSPRRIIKESGYCFRWHTAHKHAQYYMSSPTDTTWYGRYEATENRLVQLQASFDQGTKQAYTMLNFGQHVGELSNQPIATYGLQ